MLPTQDILKLITLINKIVERIYFQPFGDDGRKHTLKKEQKTYLSNIQDKIHSIMMQGYEKGDIAVDKTIVSRVLQENSYNGNDTPYLNLLCKYIPNDVEVSIQKNETGNVDTLITCNSPAYIQMAAAVVAEDGEDDWVLCSSV